MMQYARWKEMMSLHERLQDVLRKATELDPREFDLELRVVHTEALLWAERHEGCVVPTFDQVIRADTHAAGHVDWFSKFPLYVAELVYGLDPWKFL